MVTRSPSLRRMDHPAMDEPRGASWTLSTSAPGAAEPCRGTRSSLRHLYGGILRSPGPRGPVTRVSSRVSGHVGGTLVVQRVLIVADGLARGYVPTSPSTNL